ncbi:MAG: HDOD domain-containing protein [Chromatiales bacterium]|nr:HDOD domain-containing protein [Chromatiales bacterium]
MSYHLVTNSSKGLDMTPKQLVSDIEGLFSLPEIFLKINALIEDPRASADDFTALISQDADLTARLLRTVNSSFYGLKAPIDTISRAITIIGTNDLRNLAVMTAACDLFSGIPADLMKMDDFWYSSVACGTLAQSFGKRCCVLHPERLLVMGVLHDIGRLVLVQQLPELTKEVLMITQGRNELLIDAERDVMGCDHAEVGALLAESWGLPVSICNAIRYHHAPMESSKYLTETAVVHVSQALAYGMQSGEDIEFVLTEIDQTALSFLRLNHDDCREIYEAIASEVEEVYAVLVGYGSSSQAN